MRSILWLAVLRLLITEKLIAQQGNDFIEFMSTASSFTAFDFGFFRLKLLSIRKGPYFNSPGLNQCEYCSVPLLLEVWLPTVF